MEDDMEEQRLRLAVELGSEGDVKRISENLRSSGIGLAIAMDLQTDIDDLIKYWRETSRMISLVGKIFSRELIRKEILDGVLDQPVLCVWHQIGQGIHGKTYNLHFPGITVMAFGKDTQIKLYQESHKNTQEGTLDAKVGYWSHNDLPASTAILWNLPKGGITLMNMQCCFELITGQGVVFYILAKAEAEKASKEKRIVKMSVPAGHAQTLQRFKDTYGIEIFATVSSD